MKNKNLLYLNIAFAVILIVLIRFVFVNFGSGQKQVPPAVDKGVQKAVPQAVGPETSIDIGQVKPKDTEIKTSNVQTIEDVYKNYSTEDVGENMVTIWSKVNPEDKAKFVETLDKQIDQAKAALVTNPGDRRAKSLLTISESLKKAAANNFNMSKEDPARK
ncbi:MAG: hypothetical protein WC779_05545 [Candidatus Omnitrophota bacterium]|jgi:hypothetical protein